MALLTHSAASGAFEKDVFQTESGDLELTFIGHGTLMLQHGGRVIHVDPYGALADYTALPKADLALITHEHGDHLDPAALAAIRAPDTAVVLSEGCARQVSGGLVMANGDIRTVKGIRIEAVPAYNRVHLRANGQPYHPKGRGNGYILTLGGTRVYLAGDTENTPEMKALSGIAIAFLPMNLPYTMSPDMAADAARAFKPRVLYPYHYGDTDPARLAALLKDCPGIAVRIRNMK